MHRIDITLPKYAKVNIYENKSLYFDRVVPKWKTRPKSIVLGTGRSRILPTSTCKPKDALQVPNLIQRRARERSKRDYATGSAFIRIWNIGSISRAWANLPYSGAGNSLAKRNLPAPKRYFLPKSRYKMAQYLSTNAEMENAFKEVFEPIS